MEQRGAFRTMDVIRALAAVAVVWGHSFNHVFAPDVAQAGLAWYALAVSAGLGRDAVLIFFVVSGFWIGRSVDRSIVAGRWSWRTYLINRLSRLWIVLVPALVIGGLLDLLGRYLLAPDFYTIFHVNGEAPFDILSRLDPITLAGNIAFLQGVAVPTWGSNSPLWTLACEFWYYVWFPTLLLAVANRRFSAIALVLTVVTMAISPLMLGLFPCWLLGVALHYLTRNRRPTLRGPTRALALGLGTAIYLVGEAIGHITDDYFLGCYAIAIGFAAMLYALIRADVSPPRFAGAVADFGSGSSYSLYAAHAPLLVLILALVVGERRWPASAEGLALAIAITLAMIVFAWGFSRFTEHQTDKVRRLLERRLPRWPQPRPLSE